mgnify:CR=1 FL=1
MAEFESAVRQNLPFVAVLADDNAWGIVVSGQKKTYGSTIASEIGPTDYIKVAEGYGALGRRVERAADLAEAVQEGFASGRPTLIQVPTARGGPAD